MHHAALDLRAARSGYLSRARRCRRRDAWSGLPLAGQAAALHRRSRSLRARRRARQAAASSALERRHRARLGSRTRWMPRRTLEAISRAARRASPASRSTGRASWASSTSRRTASPTAGCMPSTQAAIAHGAAARGGGRRHSRHRRRVRPGPAPTPCPSTRSLRRVIPVIEGLRGRTDGADLHRHAQGRGDAPRRRRRRRHPQRRLGADARPARAAASPPRAGCPSSSCTRRATRAP